MDAGVNFEAKNGHFAFSDVIIINNLRIDVRDENRRNWFIMFRLFANSGKNR
jgi:hypothetical protein